ncbi:hypothetical protein PM02_13950 [Sulfitobacter mediterraneus]|uniref:Uncharacterized protein n=1 Tax=Sulfitobacter mediterraneus TaxID=83219 RepID=A0A061SP08_9RHOB|nr:hypothetical protein PM02_13950 [Sulfitobacter mediterraneus]
MQIKGRVAGFCFSRQKHYSSLFRVMNKAAKIYSIALVNSTDTPLSHCLNNIISVPIEMGDRVPIRKKYG